ncbi:MAG: ribulose-phosphate 3-epimerase [Bacteroidetes bacterium]|nr:ribulose-phosphate 3-epimerase [Bacteroidota bacterium]
MNHLIAPSMISADFSKLREEVEMVNESDADWFHLDVMDGVFVPNITFGFPVISSIKKYSRKPLDVHLMIKDPDPYLEQFKDSGADNLTVHIEGCDDLPATISKIKALDMNAGVAFNPETPVSTLNSILEGVYLICLMSVNPGFGGQSFIESSISKIRELRSMLQEKKLNAIIEVDGGVTLENAATILEAGGDVLVAGNTVFGSETPSNTITKLKNISAEVASS